MSMFCYQCEQTDRSNLGNLLPGCAGSVGVCGKTDTTAGLQDVLNHVSIGLGQYAQALREHDAADDTYAEQIAFFLFTTLTNVNFNPTRFVQLIAHAAQLRTQARQALVDAGGDPDTLGGAASLSPAVTLDDLTEQAKTLRVDAQLASSGADIVGLCNLLLYGLKGTCAYAHHAHQLGVRRSQVAAGIEKACTVIANPPEQAEQLLERALELGSLNYEVMAMLDEANTSTFGVPSPTQVRTTPVAGKAILVSGHDLADLAAVLKATEGTGIKVYTHGELLPAHGYPKLGEYSHLVGNYGGAWQDQQAQFDAFPGPIVMTSNCLIEPRPSYRARVFTMGPVGWPGVRHVRPAQLSLVVRAAQARPGFTDEQAEQPESFVWTGHGHHAVLNMAQTVIDAVKRGDISRFFVVGGCDGAAPGRNYYTEVAEQAPKDTVLLTLGCNKYRFNDHDFGDIGGVPRLLDVGQCNDAYGAVQIALALADAFDCGVNELPLSLFISWFEQKAAAVLLTLLSLGIHHIRVGPTLPAFLTPAVVQILADQCGLKPITDASTDLTAAMAGN